MSSYLLYQRSEIMSRLSGTENDLQRRVWLIGRQNASKSFGAVFTRRRRGDLETQSWRHHDEEEVEYIAAGRMLVQIGGPDEGVREQFEAAAGDMFLIPAGVDHRADAVGDELCIGVLFCPTPYDITTGQPSVTAQPAKAP